jgi:hypothetical protein
VKEQIDELSLKHSIVDIGNYFGVKYRPILIDPEAI